METIFFGKIDWSWKKKNMEIYKWKRMVLGALRCMNNENLKKKTVNYILDLLCQKLRQAYK